MTYLTIKQRFGGNFGVIFEMVLESNRTVWTLGDPEQVAISFWNVLSLFAKWEYNSYLKTT